MPYGYTGKILHVDLGTRCAEVEEPEERFYRTYFGGWGFIAHYLLTRQEPGVDPLGPDNQLIFAPGVLSGASIATSGRHAIGAKSPLTGGFAASEVGGFWATELKRAGFDALVIRGAAPSPTYLWIHDGEVEFRDASHLWGQKTGPAQALIRQELGDENVRVAQIGPGGERLVRFAAIMHDVCRAAGRPGLGAVMGSKNLKAIACRGKRPPEIADEARLKAVNRAWAGIFKEHPRTAGLYRHGTSGGLLGINEGGGLPTRNFQEGQFEGAEKLSGEAMSDSILVGSDSCTACYVRCKRVVEVDDRYQVDPVYGGPEYETLASLGSCCGVDDLQAVAKGSELCNAYGLDTIGAGVGIAFGMECFERGLIDEEDTGGLELRFGNADAMVQMVEKIANREGLGDILAEGLRPAARRIGKGAERYAMEVKGQAFPLHEPRFKPGMGVGYMISPTGAEHVTNIHDTAYASRESYAFNNFVSMGFFDPMPAQELSSRKMRALYYQIMRRNFENCGVLCIMTHFSNRELVEIVESITGWETTIWEIMKVGERAYSMARSFNVREGFTPADDRLPARMTEAFDSGPLKGKVYSEEDWLNARNAFYGIVGWDERTGVPTAGKLWELGLDWLVDELRKRGKLAD